MTLRTKTLTAVAALTISAAGFAFGQTAAPEAETEQQQPVQAQQTPAEAAQDAATQTETAAEDAAEAAADTAAEAEAAVTDAAETARDEADTPVADDTDPAAETVTPAEQEAAGETATDAPAADATTADDPAAETATEENLDEQATPEPTDEAVEVTPAEENAPAGTEAETAGEAVDAAAPTETVETAGEAAEEEAAAGDPEAPAEAEEGHGEEAAASHGGGHIEDIAFSFEGPFGKFDQFQLQRGLQVYTEVCSACHGLRYVPIRTLSDDGGPGLPEDQVRAYAANLTPILDEETGEERPRLPTDHFPTVLGDGMGPDLSLMAKARAGFHGPYGTGISQLINGIGGPEYIHAILSSYTGDEVEQAGTVFYVNDAFSTGQISMPPPLSDGLVTYEDGTEATVDQMATDVSAFLMWTAEPKMMARKQVGFSAVLLLLVLSGLLYYTNKRLWAPYKGKNLHK